MLGRTGWRHSTWAGTNACYPSLYFEPRTIQDVQQLCRNAQASGQTITVVGAGHSPSTLTMTQSWLVSLDRLNCVIGPKGTDGKGFTDIEVEGGIRLKELNEFLGREGLALQNLGSISEQSIAGVISTGTHGSSAFHGLISDQIVELVLVNGHGDLVVCSEVENKELFRAALLSLGALGVIVRATVRCVPAFTLKSEQRVVEFDEFLNSEDFIEFFTSAEFHRIWWYPYASKLVLWKASRCDSPVTAPAYSFYGTRLGRFVYELLLWVAARVRPQWTPFVEKWLFSHQFNEKEALVQVDRSDRAINMDCLFSQFVDEWALPLSQGKDVLRELQTEIEKQEFYVHSPIEIRVSNTTLPSELSTSPSSLPNGEGARHGNVVRPYLDPSPKLHWAPMEEVGIDQLTLNLNATVYRPFGTNTPYNKWFKAFETICASHSGRPHWAKNFLTRDMPALYGLDLREWQAQREAFDPEGIFGNRSWLKEHLLI